MTRDLLTVNSSRNQLPPKRQQRKMRAQVERCSNANAMLLTGIQELSALRDIRDMMQTQLTRVKSRSSELETDVKNMRIGMTSYKFWYFLMLVFLCSSVAAS